MHKQDDDNAKSDTHLLIEVPRDEGPQNSGEYAAAAFIRHVGHGQHIEVAQEAVGDGVAPPSRWSHGSHKLGVNNLSECTWRSPFIPTLQPM